jgi:dTDP-4-dehydrorhamnose reductase
MRVAVLGARGQLGACVVHECSVHHEVAAFDRAALDITDSAQVAGSLKRSAPDVIVNCVAYNDVDGAEDQQVRALEVNALAVRTLARTARDLGAALVHYSTDFVFDGTSPSPYKEDDRPNPRSVYATSKLLGEWFAADAPIFYVLRVESLFGRSPDGGPERGSAAAILKTLKSGGVARVFEDRTVSPTYVVDAAKATRAIIEQRPPGGIYHCVNSGCCTWLELACELARLLGVEPRLEAVRFADAKLRASRPQYCALANDKLASVGIVMAPWQDALGRYVESVR